MIHEEIARPDTLSGVTYKIKRSGLDHAIYLTVNDMDIEGKLVPYEILINTKDPINHAWVMAITRLVSAVMRKGGDISFIPAELQAISDPKGGYFHKGKYIPSIVADIGMSLETHFRMRGII